MLKLPRLVSFGLRQLVQPIPPFLKAGGTPNEYRVGIERAIAKGWLSLHESGTYVKFTQARADLIA